MHVQNSISSAGATALDILERSPGVVINKQSGIVALNGKEGVGILINGNYRRIPASALPEMLRGINSSTIESIELIANPPARYDAEGIGGLINIVLKKNTNDGTSGLASLTSGYGLGEKTGAAFTLTHRHKKLSLYSDYSFFRDRTRQLYTLSRSYEETGKQSYTCTQSKRRAVNTNQRATLGFDYSIDAVTILGSMVSGYINNWQMDAHNQTLIQTLTDTTLVEVENSELNRWQHLMGNLNLSHTFRQGQLLRIDADYLVYHDSNPSSYLNSYKNTQQEILNIQQAFFHKETPIRMGVIKMDYQHSLTSAIFMEAGVKGTFSRFNNDVAYTYQQEQDFITDPLLSQKHQLHERIGAAYTSWQMQAGANTKITAGLRYEFTDTQLSSGTGQEITHKKYGSFFPNALLSHNLGKARSIGISYGRRINRPTFNDLAPFVIFYGPNNFESGNPELQASFNHTLKVQYQWKELVGFVQYSFDNNLIAGYQPHFNPQTNELFNYAENLKQSKALSLSVLFPWQLTPWWSMQHSLLGIRQQLKAEYLPLPEKLTNLNIRINSTQSFLLPFGFSLELSGYYQSPFLYGIYLQKATGVFNMGLQKKLNGERGTLSLTWDDVLWTTAWRWDYDRPNQHLYTDATFAMGEPRVVKVTYTRSFGNKKVKPAQDRSSGSEEERKRVQ